jgi:hypothetical protein
MRRSSRLVWLLVVVVLLVASACGRGSDDEPSTPRRTGTATATATGSGIVNPLAPQLFPTFTFISDDELMSTATVSGCPITPYVRVEQADGTTVQLRYEANGIRVFMDQDDEGRWYVGPMGFHWEADPPAAGEMVVSATSRDHGTRVRGESLDSNGEHYASIVFPEPGCWDVTANVGEQEVAFTVRVIPELERPAIRAQLEARAAARPWDVPADCAVTELGDPFQSTSIRTLGQLFYSVEGTGMRLSGDLDLLFEGENVLRWYPDTWVEPVIEGRQLDGNGTALVTSLIRSVDEQGEHAATTVLFPLPGCWQLTGADGERMVEAVVNVYPAGCRPSDDHSTAVPGNCEHP